MVPVWLVMGQLPMVPMACDHGVACLCLPGGLPVRPWPTGWPVPACLVACLCLCWPVLALVACACLVVCLPVPGGLCACLVACHGLPWWLPLPCPGGLPAYGLACPALVAWSVPGGLVACLCSALPGGTPCNVHVYRLTRANHDHIPAGIPSRYHRLTCPLPVILYLNFAKTWGTHYRCTYRT
jgi:hypothetical protein